MVAMPYSATTIANEFLRLAQRDGKRLTNMQLQKLVYIAHGFYLAIAGKPLLSDAVKAWQWGPVIVNLYEALKRYGAGVVINQIPAPDDRLDLGAKEIIEKVWKAYGRFQGFQLSAITHKKNSPWSTAWEEGPYGTIPNDLIREYYRNLLNERRKTTQPA